MSLPISGAVGKKARLYITCCFELTGQNDLLIDFIDLLLSLLPLSLQNDRAKSNCQFLFFVGSS